MLNRRKFISLIVGALAAPKSLMAAPLRMKFRQSGITTAEGIGGYKSLKPSNLTYTDIGSVTYMSITPHITELT